MDRNSRRNRTKIAARIVLAVFLCAVLVLLGYERYVKNIQNAMQLKSRYTYTTDLSNSDAADLQTEAQGWLTGFLGQFTQKYVPRSKALTNVEIGDIQILNTATDTVLLSFSAELKDSTSEYFSSWDGVTSNGRLACEWVVTFDTAYVDASSKTVFVSGMETPEEYGIAQYNENSKNAVSSNTETATTSSEDSMTRYQIKNNSLEVSYNGGQKYTVVPVDVNNLRMQDNSTTELQEGSYYISTDMTAFLFGGMTSGGEQIPVTIVYSTDKGGSWVTCEIESLYDVDYCYVNFFDASNGIVVLGYAKNETQEYSRIYRTEDKAEDWNSVGSGPANNVIKGVNFLDEQTGFFCYEYVDGMDSNLYLTQDGGKSFSKVQLEAQQLDSDAGNVQWSDIYKEALVPFYDDNGTLTVYLTQGSSGTYNSGKTAAKYQSADKGVTWKYIGQMELTTK